jgi:hypothetical protein
MNSSHKKPNKAKKAPDLRSFNFRSLLLPILFFLKDALGSSGFNSR